MKKLINLLSLTLLCSTLLASTALAAETRNGDAEIHQAYLRMENKYGNEVDVYFDNSNTGATYNDVQQIIDSHPDSVSFTIYEVGVSDDAKDSLPDIRDLSAPYNWAPPVGSTHQYTTEKTITTPSRVVRDDFVISVAKGETVSLGHEYTGTLEGQINGEYFNKSKLGIKLSVTCKYSATKTFTCPDSAKGNSREFRVKFYQADGTYIQKDTCYKPDGSLYGIRTHGGDYKEAVKYSSYSIDSYQ